MKLTLKRILPLIALSFSLAITLFFIKVHAQTNSLPSATPSTITVPITGTGNCSTTNTCVGSTYYQTGTVCPSTLTGSSGWLSGPSFVEPGAASITISGVSPATSYLVDVEGAPTSSPTSFNGPSNCQVVTTPFHPAPFVIGIPSAS
jgi:hypothetical protein